ncbi:MAG TPA: hypothetical protein VI299_08560, partial [Polyangiales bacterium]
ERLSERQLAPKTSHTGTSPMLPRHKDEEPPRRPSVDVAAQARSRAVHALLARDFEEVERALELLVAAGRDGTSVDRLRAVTLLVKGDRAGASLLLARLHEAAANWDDSPKLLLTQALVSIAGDAPSAAVRAGLRALASARKAHDKHGERACLSVLALCYRALGRDAEAQRMAQAALAADDGARAHA